MMRTMTKKCICMIMAVAMLCSLIAAVPPVQASGYMKVSAQTKSFTSIRLSWEKKKVSCYKIYRAEDGSSGTTKYKYIATVSGKKTNYTDKKLKQGKSYTYMVYAYKNGKKCYSGYVTDYTGMSCYFDDYQVSDAQRSTEFVTLNLYAEIGLMPDGYQIERRQTGTKKYKKLVTVKKKARSLSYKDRSVEAGHVYDYRVRTYAKLGKKTYYSPYVSVVKQHASNQIGQFTLLKDQNTSGDPKELVLGLTAADGNGDMLLDGYGYYDISNQDGTWSEDPVRITAYKVGQGAWTAFTVDQDTPIVIRENETVWIRLTTTAQVDLRTLTNRLSYTINLTCRYNDLTSMLSVDMIKNEAYADVDLEYYH